MGPELAEHPPFPVVSWLGPPPCLEDHDRASRMLTETTQHRWLIHVEPRACAGPTSSRVSAQMIWYNRQMIWCDRSSSGYLKPVGETETNLRQLSFPYSSLLEPITSTRKSVFFFSGWWVGFVLSRLAWRWGRWGRRGRCRHSSFQVVEKSYQEAVQFYKSRT